MARLQLVSDADHEGRIISVCVQEAGTDLLRAEHLGDSVTFDGHSMPVPVFRRFLRASTSMLNDHQVDGV